MIAQGHEHSESSGPSSALVIGSNSFIKLEFLAESHGRGRKRVRAEEDDYTLSTEACQEALQESV
ncbi:hypothetical protein NQZ68_013070 [Dissostichus eleginoides]|nr:hypothetical protein NQZ68_013070 [Dissostichus eleginoides]